MKISICKHQFFGDCKCSYDVDKNHHPNNFDCPKYEPMGYVLIDLEKEGENVQRTHKTPSVAPLTERENKQP
jgi:hypothetical protein